MCKITISTSDSGQPIGLEITTLNEEAAHSFYAGDYETYGDLMDGLQATNDDDYDDITEMEINAWDVQMEDDSDLYTLYAELQKKAA